MQKTIQINTLSECLYWRMVEQHVQAKDVAALVGCAPSTISHITSGNGTGLHRQWIIPIARWCELTPDELWTLLEGEIDVGAEPC